MCNCFLCDRTAVARIKLTQMVILLHSHTLAGEERPASIAESTKNLRLVRTLGTCLASARSGR